MNCIWTVGGSSNTQRENAHKTLTATQWFRTQDLTAVRRVLGTANHHTVMLAFQTMNVNI